MIDPDKNKLTDFEVVGTTRSVHELHVTGGVRALETSPRLWSWRPVLHQGRMRALHPQPIDFIGALAKAVGAELFGGDEIQEITGPLIFRTWTPLDGWHNAQPQPADQWSAIGQNAAIACDPFHSKMARNIAFSLRAAGIRLRDASDHYRNQLMAAIEENRKHGSRFSNLPLKDLQIAFHSVLSEIGSVRDYIASVTARRLAAPDKIDSMARFLEWVSAPSRSHFHSDQIVRNILNASEKTSSDPFLLEIGEYRNKFLHREPLGSAEMARWLVYCECEHGGHVFPSVALPLSGDRVFASGDDALTRFVSLYRSITALVRRAASLAPYSGTPPVFTVAPR